MNDEPAKSPTKRRARDKSRDEGQSFFGCVIRAGPFHVGFWMTKGRSQNLVRCISWNSCSVSPLYNHIWRLRNFSRTTTFQLSLDTCERGVFKHLIWKGLATLFQARSDPRPYTRPQLPSIPFNLQPTQTTHKHPPTTLVQWRPSPNLPPGPPPTPSPATPAKSPSAAATCSARTCNPTGTATTSSAA